MNVWGVNVIDRDHAQRRAIVATRTKAEAVSAFGVSRYYLDQFGCTTGNKFELALARSRPGVVFVKQADPSANAETSPWKPWT